jgi:hypothetical protein
VVDVVHIAGGWLDVLRSLAFYRTSGLPYNDDMYRHVQVGWLMLLVLGGTSITIGLSYWKTRSIMMFVLLVLALLATFVFSHMSVVADDVGLEVRLACGVIKRSISWRQVERAYEKEVGWVTGWGIRRINNGWLYNVSGNKAIALKLINSQEFWIGTDDPLDLMAFVRKHISS